VTNEPVMTWNLILCAVGIPSLGYYIRTLLNDREESSKERHEILTKEIERMRACINNIKQEMDEKRDIDDCEDRSREKWERINRHMHDTNGHVVIP
jgi:hypothetical protein